MGKIEKALMKTNSIKSLFSKMASPKEERSTPPMEVDNDKVTRTETSLSGNKDEGDVSKISEKTTEQENKKAKNKKENIIKEKKGKKEKDKKEKVIKEKKKKKKKKKKNHKKKKKKKKKKS